MTLKELRKFINEIPEEMDNYELVNGEFGYLDMEDDNSVVYRVDKPISTLYVDEQSQEVCFFHQTREDVNEFYNQTNDDTETAE